jgi:molybdopterin/thiamine biosynthesis adenylyltransferase
MEEIDATLLSVEDIINLYPEAELPAIVEAHNAAQSVQTVQAVAADAAGPASSSENNTADPQVAGILQEIREALSENPSHVETPSSDTVETTQNAARRTHRRRGAATTTETVPETTQVVSLPQEIAEAAIASGEVANAVMDLNATIEETLENNNTSEDNAGGVVGGIVNDAAQTVEQPHTPQVTVEEQHNTFDNISGDNIATDIGSRFSGAAWFEAMQNTKIIVAGCGGIGSWFTLLAARANPESIQLFDADNVESANLSGQLFGLEHVGMNKANALASIVQNYCNYNRIEVFNIFYTGRTRQVGPIMVCGFDNMAARKVYFNKWKEYAQFHTNERCLYIDGRLNAEQFQVFCITGDRPDLMAKYEEDWLFDDSEADGVLCSYKQTSYCAAMIGGMMNNLLVNFIFNGGNNILYPRDLPFLTVYEADQLFLRTRV